jgi:translation initiation factor eIF-2B subunit gamma
MPSTIVLNVVVESVLEDCETADILRKISHRLTAVDFVVVSGDLISDVPLGTVAATHRRQGAVMTALLCHHPNFSSSDATTSSPAKDKLKQSTSDIVGLDATHEYLLFLASRGQVEKDLKIRRSLLQAVGHMELHTDLVDAQLYAFNRKVVLEVLETRPGIKSIKLDLVPYLVRSQLRVGSGSIPPAAASPDESSDNLPGGLVGDRVPQSPSPGDEVATLLRRVCFASPSSFRCCVYVASQANYCARVSSLQAYMDINRAVSGEIVHLTGHELSKQNNVVHATAVLGSKTTIGTCCIVGEGSQMGDKCRIKRSVVGRHCRIGSNVTITNSVVMNYVTIEDYCSIQGSVICSNALLQQRSSLRDCQVGPSYNVAENTDHREEALVKKEKS